MQDDFRPQRIPPQRPVRPPMPSVGIPPNMPQEPDYEDDDDERHDRFVAKTAFVFIGVLFLMIVSGLVYWLYLKNSKVGHTPTQNTPQTSEIEKVDTVEALSLDPNKNYGDKYANGILPVGDQKYVTDGAKKGHVYMCDTKNFVPANQAGAQTRGPWFVSASQWNINKKYAVQGNREWKPGLTNEISNGLRIINTNGLPSHTTGIFPVTSKDPAHSYDSNPNSILPQGLKFSLAASPEYGAPQCMGGEVGVILTGVTLFNAFDAGGRDAGAWEVQDACGGHPQKSGIYHYHTLSSCIKNVGVGDVIGFALDGFPITGPKLGDKNYLTTNDLDECHGIVSDIVLDNKRVKTYHYVMTQDFPYSVSCFRGSAPRTQKPNSQQPQSSAPTSDQGGLQVQGGPQPNL